MTGDEREFLISLQNGTPEWDKINISGIADLPAVKWKLQSVLQMKEEKRNQAVKDLEKKVESLKNHF